MGFEGGGRGGGAGRQMDVDAIRDARVGGWEKCANEAEGEP